MSPFISQIIGVLVRTTLAGAGGYLIAHGWATQDQFNEFIAGLIPVIVAIAWSVWQKYRHLIRVNTALAMPSGTSNADLDKQIASGDAAPAVVPKTEAPFIVGTGR